tara:strand:+ start:2267 stop:2617 length:351 start_codon:yes stop_codon:yes gene_type:complete
MNQAAMNNLPDWMLEKETPAIQIKSPKVKALIFCKESVEKIGCTWDEVISKDRKRRIVDARKCVSKHLIAHGWTTEAAGAQMNRHYSTVVYHKQKFKTLHEYDAGFRHTWSEFSRL